MSILVTGGAGFIGSHLVESLLDQGENVVILDNLGYPQSHNDDDFYVHHDSPNSRNIDHLLNKYPDDRLLFIMGDITDQRDLNHTFKVALRNKIPITRVVHLAALAGVLPSIRQPTEYVRVNVLGTQMLAETATQNGVISFVFASSSSVYGESPWNTREHLASVSHLGDSLEERLVPEDEWLIRSDLPLSPYAGSKKAAEVILCATANVAKVYVTVCRLFTVYGPRGRKDMAVYKFCDAIYKGKDICVSGDGTQTRDYTYVSDTVDALSKAVTQPTQNYTKYFRILNVGTGISKSNNLLIETLGKYIGWPGKRKHFLRSELEPEHTLAAITSAAQHLNFKAQVDFDEGIKRFVEWYKKEEELKKHPPYEFLK